ncbi:MAG: hypothetical protein U9O94_11440 [Nanoarchaeota archaeon]|nr:hypothetical protein [Nanoarchaeota archaeon]
MAAPSYTTDLTTIATGDLNVDAGTWDESSDAGWDTGGSMVDDENLYYNNTECVSAQMTKDSNGTGAAGPATILYNHTAAFTIPTDGAALIHHMWAAPPALNTIDNVTSAGINICAGSSLGDFYAWKASGSDFAPAPRGGWANYAINPAIGSPDHTVGTAPTTYSMIGIGVSATAQARGNPNACNAVRYGRCESIFTDGDLANGYATFLGYSAVDDSSTNKWNLVEPVEGGYKFQGLMSLGTTTTSVDFRDENANITIRDTINVTTAFNAIEINHASSNVEWTAISITALGTNSKGTFEMVANATVSKTACTFTDMNTFVYQSNGTISNSIYRRCGQITQGGATFTGCTFDNSTSAVTMLVSSLNVVTGCTFNSDGSNHAVNLGTISTDTTVSWDNLLNDYATANGSTGNEAILVSVDNGVTLTINLADGADTPYYYNTGTGTVVVQSSSTLTLTVKDENGDAVGSAYAYIDDDNITPFIMNTTTNVTTGIATATWGGGAVVGATWRVRKYGYKPFKVIADVPASGTKDIPVTLVADPQQT